MGKLEIKCILCERRGGVDEELNAGDFGFSEKHGAIVCKDCYISPRSVVQDQMTQKNESRIQQSSTIAAALERRAEAQRKADPTRGIG